MTMSLQAISDRLEIEAVLIRYCEAIDNGTIDDFDNIFTADALIDFSNFGGPKGSVEEIKKFLKENLGTLPKQHILSNLIIKVDGDQASSKCICFNPQGFPNNTGSYQMAFFGLWYEDTLIHADNEWKINSRVSKPSFTFNLPQGAN